MSNINWEAHAQTFIAKRATNVTLRVFVDRSVCEAYCAGGVITSRLFPRDPLNATAIDVFVEGGSGTLLQLDVWSVGSMWRGVT